MYMYGVKTISEGAPSRLLNQTTWLVERTVRFSELTITPNAVLIAPEGKTVTLVVNGVSHDIVPGTYYGDVVLNVAEVYHMEPHSLMRMSNVSRNFAAALVVDENGAQVRIPDMFQGGTVDDHGVVGTYLATTEQSFNGIVLPRKRGLHSSEQRICL